MRRSRECGFTLLEVMMAMAILAGSLTVLMHRTVSNIRDAQRGQMMGVVSDLLRGQMYDLEEALLKEGFQETNQELDGDFSDQGWPDVKWSAEIRKIELPNLTAMQEGVEGQIEGQTGGEGAEPALDPFTSLLGGMDTGGGNPMAAAGASLIGSQFETISSVLEQAVRKVIVTASYEVAGDTETITVDCYFTDVASISRVLPPAGAPNQPAPSPPTPAPRRPGR